MEKKILYRYDIQYHNDEEYQSVGVILRKYEVVRQTEKMYFINNGGWKLKRILKTSQGKRYAYDNRESAMENFKRRTRRRIEWFDYWKENCKVALQLTEKMSIEDEHIEDTDNKILDSI